MREFIYWLQWLYHGKPMVTCPGSHCGCCGAWIPEEVKVRDYEDYGWGHWSICQKCIDESEGNP